MDVMLIREEVIRAAEDYKYLLNRGYNQKSALDFVTSRYMLTPTERALLLRCVHRDDEAFAIRRKITDSIEGMELIIDGYNTLLTLVSVFEGRNVYLCDDCIIRDLRSSYIKDFSSPLIIKAINELASFVKTLRPKRVVVVLDKNVSWSGRHSEVIRNTVPEFEVKLAKKADIEVIASLGIISSSDFVILSRAKYVFDVAGRIIANRFRDKIVRFDRVVCKEPCRIL